MSYACPVQTFLRNGGTLEDLTAKYAIKIKRHGEYPNIVQLKYSQIASPMGDPIVQECRGLILDESDGWRAIARPFRKFFNLGEGHAANIDWESAVPLEKLDGSLAIVYHYQGAWHMATSGTPDASGPLGDSQKTFKDLFWYTFGFEGYSLKHLDQDHTYMFELMTPENRVVVPHPVHRLVMTGIRNRDTGVEVDLHGIVYPMVEPLAVTARSNFKVVKAFYDLRNNVDHPQEIIEESFKTMDGLKQEGYVVVDKHFNRVKVKHPQYVVYHQLVGSLTKKKVLDAVRKGESPEILTYFPTWKAEFDEMKSRLDALTAKYKAAYETIRDIPVQKDFALAVQKLGMVSGPFFTVRKSNAKPEVVPAGVVLSAKRLAQPVPTPITFEEYFAELRIESLAGMLGLKEEEVTDEVPGSVE